jgi:hypothetical protein
MPWLSSCRVDVFEEAAFGVQYLIEILNVPLRVVVAGGVLWVSLRVAAFEKAVAAYPSGKGYGNGGTMVVMFFTDRGMIASVQVYGRALAQSAESDSNERQ